jgi:hypothetical protein
MMAGVDERVRDNDEYADRQDRGGSGDERHA